MNNIFQNARELKSVLSQGVRFTLVGGCFDLIHVGHIHLFEYAATLEKLLVVAVLSDKYVKTYKARQQPIINEQQRAKMVASVRYVDFVFVSDVSPSSPEVLQILRPDSVVFEREGDRERILQRKKNIQIFSPNTKIRFLPRYTLEEISTAHIVRKIKGLGLGE